MMQRVLARPCLAFCSAVALTGALALSAFSSATFADEVSGPVAKLRSGVVSQPPSIDEIEGLTEFDIESIVVPGGIPEQLTVLVPIDGEVLPLTLERRSFRSPDARLLVDRGAGLVEEELPPHRTYRGRVAGLEDTTVVASVLDGTLWATIDFGGDLPLWVVQPLTSFDDVAGRAGVGDTRHVIYREDHAFSEDAICGNDLFDLAAPEIDPRDIAPEGGVAGGTIYYAQIAFDADFEFFQDNGSSVDATVNDIELVYNLVNNIYSRDANIEFEFTTFVVRASSADPYTSTTADGLLCQFRAEWNSGERVSIERDVAQLFTGRSIAGSTIGLAWVGVVCNQSGNDCGAFGNLAYGIVESNYTNSLTLRTSLSAHELGHNWGASHCNSSPPCHVMCASNGSCNGVSGTNLKFGSAAAAQIVAFRNSVGCDVVLPSELELPFSDGFDSGLSSSNWIFRNGATASTSGVGEPSPTRSLNLDATGAGEFADDEIRSNFILAGDASDLTLSIWTQHRGVESGESLFVEYYSSGRDWVLLEEIVSDGTDQASFTRRTYELPSNAAHNSLRIRFRANVDQSNDDWFIDDVEIFEGPVVEPPSNDDCFSAIAANNGVTSFTTVGATDTPFGLPSSCDEGAGVEIGEDVWFVYSPTCTGLVTISTCNAVDFDSRMAAYSGLAGCPVDDTTLIACRDDSVECASGSTLLEFEAQAFIPIYVRVGSRNGETGSGLLVITCEEIVEPCPPDFNDDGEVNGADLGFMLGSWGTPGADINEDGTTDGADLGILLGSWGSCS